MPRRRRRTWRFHVKERRVRTVEYLIEATDAGAAGRLDGTILDESDGADDTGLELLSVEPVGDDVDEVP